MIKPAGLGLVICGLIMIFCGALFVVTGKVESRGGLVTDSPLGVWSFAFGFVLGGVSSICLALSVTIRNLSSGLIALSYAGTAMVSLSMGVFSIWRGIANARALLPEPQGDYASDQWFKAVGLIVSGLLLLGLSGRLAFVVLRRRNELSEKQVPVPSEGPVRKITEVSDMAHYSRYSRKRK